MTKPTEETTDKSRTRLIIDTDPDIKLAVKLAAMQADDSVSAVVNAALRKAFAEQIKDARKYTGGKSR